MLRTFEVIEDVIPIARVIQRIDVRTGVRGHDHRVVIERDRVLGIPGVKTFDHESFRGARHPLVKIRITHAEVNETGHPRESLHTQVIDTTARDPA